MSKKILMIVTSHNHINAERLTGIWFEEFAIPYAVFREHGYAITVASPKGGQAPIDPNSYPPENEREAFSEVLNRLATTEPITAITSSKYDAVFLPGGHGTMFDLPMPEIGQIVGQFANADKVIAAVCHGPAGLITARRADGNAIVKGYQVTGFTNAEEDAANLTTEMPFLLQDKLTELGAEFIATPLWNDHVVVDRKLITGQNPQSSKSTAQAVIDLLERVATPA
ncbi:MAG: type 1 glutamine amidotransferase domain-containing protein [Chloroflexota bacterium]